MEQKFKDFLYHFTTDDHWVLDFQVKPEHAILINDLLRLNSVLDLQNFAEQIGDRWFVGMHFLFQCFEHVHDANRLAFLEFVWEMFWNGTFSENTDGFHPWVGYFDPLDEEDPKTKFATWFREGVIRFELNEDDIEGSLSSSVNPYWWENLNHFLNEVCAYQSPECLFNVLDYFANKIYEQELGEAGSDLSTTGQSVENVNNKKQFLLNHKLNKIEALDAFKSWASDKLHSYNFHT